MRQLNSIVVPAMMCAFSVTASAQTEYKILEDLTAQKLTNYDFSADAPVTTLVRTYAKDLQDAGLGAGGEEMYGQQPVTGWTATYPTDNIKNEPSSLVGGDARAAAVYAYRNEATEDLDAIVPGLGGDYHAPYDENCTSVTGGKALGMVAVWGAAVQYTQDVTLAPGCYMIVVPVTNTSGTGAISKSLNGFITDEGVEYLPAKKSYDVIGEQVNDTIAFKLTTATTGKISVGYQVTGIGSAAAPHLFVDCVKLYSIDASAIDAQEVAEAKETLLAVIEEGEQLGVNTSAAQAVYDNPNATLDEVLAAIDSQKEANAAGVTDFSDFFINNAHFNLDPAIEDGITTYDYDMEKNNVSHYGMQPVTGWEASNPTDNNFVEGRSDEKNARACGVFAIGSEAFLGGPDYLPPTVMSDGSAEGKVLGFISVWSATTQYKQAVSIPAGKYTLIISYYNAGGTGAVDKNLMGFITDSGEEYLADVKTFKEKSWEQMKIMFELDEATAGYFSLGFKAGNAGSGSMPHFFIDGITLNYVGDVTFDPSLLALQAVVSSQSGLLDEAMESSVHDQLADAINNASQLVSSQSSDADANKAALDAISDLMPAVHASIDAYKKLYGLIEQLEEESADEELGSIGNMADLISEMLDDLMDAYDEGSLTADEIDAKFAEHDQMILDEVVRVLNSDDAAGTDITALLKNPSFDNGSEGWQGTVPTVRAGVAEFFNKTFDMYQVLEGLPNGKYEIKVSGFHRFDSSVNTLAARLDGSEEDYIAAYVYGNDDATKFKSIFEGASTDGVKTHVADDGTENNYVYYKDDLETDLGYVPNTMEGFAAAETMTDAYETVATAIVKDGTLRFGVRLTNNPSSNAWTIFDSFRVKYVGNSASDYAESIIKAAEALLEVRDAYLNDSEFVVLPGETQTNVDELYAEATALAENASTVEECTAMLDKLADARQHIEDVVARAKELLSLVTYYETAIAEYDVEYDIDEYYGKVMENGWETEAELEDDIAAIVGGWATVVQEGNGSATDKNPFDATPMLRNPGFTWAGEDTKDYWTIVNDYGDASESLIEFWGKSSWEVSQKVAGLTAGFYQLSVQALYRPFGQLTDVVIARMDGTEPHDVFVFANNGTSEWKSEIMNILDCEQDLSEVVVDGANRNVILSEDLVTKHRTYAAGTTLTSPTGHQFTRAYFDYDPEGLYDDPTNMGFWKNNTVVFEVKEGETMTLGCRKDEVNTDGGNWTPMDNFQLFYLGTTAPDAVKGIVAAGAVVRQDCYTIDGVRLARPVKGVNLIVTTYADGHKTTVKTVVK